MGVAPPSLLARPADVIAGPGPVGQKQHRRNPCPAGMGLVKPVAAAVARPAIARRHPGLGEPRGQRAVAARPRLPRLGRQQPAEIARPGDGDRVRLGPDQPVAPFPAKAGAQAGRAGAEVEDRVMGRRHQRDQTGTARHGCGLRRRNGYDRPHPARDLAQRRALAPGVLRALPDRPAPDHRQRQRAKPPRDDLCPSDHRAVIIGDRQPPDPGAAQSEHPAIARMLLHRRRRRVLIAGIVPCDPHGHH